jgi:hypothetical protein
LAVIAEEQHQRQQEEYQDPLSVFIYALKAPETKRQWPRRLKVFFDFLKLEEPIEEQAKQFLIRTKQDFSILLVFVLILIVYMANNIEAKRKGS